MKKDDIRYQTYVNILKEELIPAFGCTEPIALAYAAAKAGLHGLTRACARELGPMGIRVNAVAPGVVLTDMVARSVTGQQLETLRRMTPLGRAATPAELTGAYVYLASEEARFTTGAVIQVDGGLVL